MRGTTDVIQFESATLGRTYASDLYLPAGYDAAADRAYEEQLPIRCAI